MACALAPVHLLELLKAARRLPKLLYHISDKTWHVEHVFEVLLVVETNTEGESFACLFFCGEI